jgi:hypothetical protein
MSLKTLVIIMTRHFPLLCSLIGFKLTASTLSPGLGGPHAWLVPDSELPLRTDGRYIIGRGGERVKWSCVNWYGAESDTAVPGGLEAQPLHSIADRILELGFNCVRLCYSTQAQKFNTAVSEENVVANPIFKGRRFFDVWDATVNALTKRGLMVIISNQLHRAGWCCHWSQDEGMWYLLPDYPESVWIDSLVNMTLRYRANPLVVGIDLRNEVHDSQGKSLTWGDGDPETDWAAAATRAGNAVLEANPDMLIVVMALCFGMDLRGAQDHPVQLTVPNRVIYEAHTYLEYQLWSLISASFVSWQSLRLISGLAVAVLLLILILLLRVWHLLGKPKPRWTQVVFTASCWVISLSLLGIAIVQGSLVLLAQAPACGFWARRDVIPTRTVFIVLASVAGAFAFFIILFGRRLNACTRSWFKEKSCHCTDGTCCSHTNGALTDNTARADCTDAQEVSADVDDTESDEEGSARRTRLLCGESSCISCRYFRYYVSRPCRAFWHCDQRHGEKTPGLAGNNASFKMVVPWDRGLCCGFQFCILITLLFLIFFTIFIFSLFAPSYSLFRTHLNNQWGFMLDDGHPYTAPVWMGEFGNLRRGEYWNNMMHYLSEYDIDFAYWAINGKKWRTGHINIQTGQWIPEEPHWFNESYGLLTEDYWTIRSPWRLMDLQALMPSPAMWRPLAPDCDRHLLGGECGG